MTDFLDPSGSFFASREIKPSVNYDASSIQKISSAVANLTCSGLVKTPANLSIVKRELLEAKTTALENKILSRLFSNAALEILIPKIIEDDPGLFFNDFIVPASESLTKHGLLNGSINYLSDIPVEFRLTPTPGSGHQKLLDKLQTSDLPGWFSPSIAGMKYDDILKFVKHMPNIVSLAGFNDGWPIVLQHPRFFLSLCNERALWLTGITSETSGVGFCLQKNRNGNLSLDRQKFEHIGPNDIHGLIITL